MHHFLRLRKSLETFAPSCSLEFSLKVEGLLCWVFSQVFSNCFTVKLPKVCKTIHLPKHLWDGHKHHWLFQSPCLKKHRCLSCLSPTANRTTKRLVFMWQILNVQWDFNYLTCTCLVGLKPNKDLRINAFKNGANTHVQMTTDWASKCGFFF